MKTPGSVKISDMRIRSPRIAPPVNGDEGSTATTATRSPRRRYDWTRRCTSVDFPAPGGPVIPTIRARPVLGKSARKRSAAPASVSTADSARPMSRTRPARTPSAIPAAVAAGSSSCAVREKALRDHELLDLARPLADRAELDVAVELLDGKSLMKP
jgi:hypothetical protein